MYVFVVCVCAVCVYVLYAFEYVWYVLCVSGMSLSGVCVV
jgi:hypothetical protein